MIANARTTASRSSMAFTRAPSGHVSSVKPNAESVPSDLDSMAKVRYLMLPERPAGSENLSEIALAKLVTRDSMIGVALL